MGNKFYKNILKKDNIFVLIALIFSLFLIIISFKIAYAKEVPPWMNRYPLNWYTTPISNSGTFQPPYTGPTNPIVSSSCNQSLFTNGGACTLSQPFITLIDSVAKLTNVPPALLPAEMSREDGVACQYDQAISGNSIQNIATITNNAGSFAGALGPLQFIKSTWNEYSPRISSILQLNFQYAVSLGVHRIILVDAMIGAGLLLSNDAGNPPTQNWTKTQIETAAGNYCGVGYGVGTDCSINNSACGVCYATGVYNLYSSYNSSCIFN